MGSLKRLEARLARLEASLKGLRDPEEEQEQRRLMDLHWAVWVLGGSFEDIPEKDRDLGLWEFQCECGPWLLELVWQGILPGREELLAAGVDFTQAAASSGEDLVGGRLYGAPGPNTPRKL
jgi:hypothetical protein